MILIPPDIGRVLDALRAAGHDAYAVGGCVRDSLLGRTPRDWDVCTAAEPEAVKACFEGRRVIETGIAHGTVTVFLGDTACEVTTFRTDGAYSDRRRPDSVTFVRELSRDLARRDFTVNAMAAGPDGAVIDPHGGREDLKNRLIRAVGDPGERFREDALRILRALRFASELDFGIEAETAAGVSENRALLEAVSAERISAELLLLLAGPGVRRVLPGFIDVFRVFIPELNGCSEAAVRRLSRAVAFAADGGDAVRLAALLHTAAEPEAAAETARKILLRLRLDGATVRRAAALLRYVSDGADGALPVAHRLAALGEAAFFELAALRRATERARDTGGVALEAISRDEAEARALIASGACLSLRDLAVDGDDLTALGMRGGAVGAALRALLRAVLDGELPNEREALLAAARDRFANSEK